MDLINVLLGVIILLLLVVWYKTHKVEKLIKMYMVGYRHVPSWIETLPFSKRIMELKGLFEKKEEEPEYW